MVSFKSNQVCEFGDFQTPDDLARQATQVLKQLNIEPQAVLEPTCGSGSFIFATMESFPEAQNFVGVEIRESHLDKLHQGLTTTRLNTAVRTICANFFDIDWPEILDGLPEPILVIGTQGKLQSSNLPKKSNFQGWKGLDALTGKSNFDISEWMLLQHIEWFRKRTGTVAMLCKTAVARKVLAHAWKHDYFIGIARIYKFDAMKYFGASVDACFFVVEFGERSKSKECIVYESFFTSQPSQTIGYRNGIVVANITSYQQRQHLHKIDKIYTWRSGIKHDCAKVMELERIGNIYRNGNGLTASLEDRYIYPLFKSSDIGNNRVTTCRKYLLVTQQCVGEDTAHIKDDAPAIWQYLQDNSNFLAKRHSSIYRNRPPFSIFGVGDYTFAPWKVAISGFYKKLVFTAISPIEGRPAVFDDTVYFLPCWSEGEARFLVEILNSFVAKEFFSSMIFWSDKRPITVELLKRLNIQTLARELDRENDYCFYAQQRLILN
jgi:hypothetical protein